MIVKGFWGLCFARGYTVWVQDGYSARCCFTALSTVQRTPRAYKLLPEPAIVIVEGEGPNGWTWARRDQNGWVQLSREGGEALATRRGVKAMSPEDAAIQFAAAGFHLWGDWR